MENAVGYIFLQYSTEDGAKAAQKAVAGRSFNGKIVKACFYPEDLYSKKVNIFIKKKLKTKNLMKLINCVSIFMTLFTDNGFTTRLFE